MAHTGQLTVYTDGASRGNPGQAAWAYVIERDGETLAEEADRLGLMTNNQAEYTALVRALEHALELAPGDRVVVHSDSELMIKQLNGEYRVKNGDLVPLYEEAKGLVRQFAQPVVFRHVRRGQNQRADQLCNEALDGVRDSVRGLPDLVRKAVQAQAKPAVASLPAGLEAEALACLRQAAGEQPEEVWKKLAAILQRHWPKRS